MTELVTQTRKWGNSLGIVLPKEIVEKEHLKENEELQIILIRKNNVLRETFGKLNGWKKTAAKIKKELKKELYND